jgi:hypothetical protein
LSKAQIAYVSAATARTTPDEYALIDAVGEQRPDVPVARNPLDQDVEPPPPESSAAPINRSRWPPGLASRQCPRTPLGQQREADRRPWRVD